MRTIDESEEGRADLAKLNAAPWITRRPGPCPVLTYDAAAMSDMRAEHRIMGNEASGYIVRPVDPEHGTGEGYPWGNYASRDLAAEYLDVYLTSAF